MTPSSRRAFFPHFQSVAVLFALGSAALGVGGCGTPFKSQEQFTLKAPAGSGRLIVENNIGDVKVVADGQAQEVSAVVTKIGRGATAKQAEQALAELEISLAVDESAGALRAKVSHPRATNFRQHEVTWRITAPPDTEVRITTAIGDATVTGFRRDVSLKTNIGDARVCCHAAGTSAVMVSTGVGDIHVSDSPRGLTATSDVGDIHASACGPVDLNGGVGDVVLHLKPTTVERVRIDSDVGDVHLHLSTSQQGKLFATADVGSVRLSLDGVTMKECRQRHHVALAQLGESATPAIDVYTDVGDVVIKTYTPAEVPPPNSVAVLSAAR